MATAELPPEPETVDALLAATVRIVEDERSRGQSADSKAGQLVGFVGVILAIDAALGRDVFDHGVSGAYSDAFAAFFLVSLVALATAAFVAIRGVFRPQSTFAFRRQDVEGLAEAPLVLAEPVEIKRTLIRTYGEELVHEESRNNRKLDVVNRASLLLIVGVLALACSGATLAVKHLAMSDSPKHAPKTGVPAAPAPVARPQPPQKLPLGVIERGSSNPPQRGSR